MKAASFLRRYASSMRKTLAMSVLTTHLVLTAIDNLPDQHVSIRNLTQRLFGMPTWRFFGPNPGVDDTHLFWRNAVGVRPTGEWQELDLTVRRPWWAPLWNPGTRGPKTLFDAVQQLRLASAQMHGDFDGLKATPAYRLLEDYVRSVVPRFGAVDHAQFLVVTSRPMLEESEMSPIVASECFPL